MPSRLFFWSLTSALAGFLFGFDTVVISGAEQRIQELWNLSASLHGVAIASALYGTVVGALFGGWPTNRFGRRATLIGIGVLYLVSALWSGLADNVSAFIIARFLGGLGVGVSTVAAPMFIAEIAPPERRGRLTALFQFNIVFGMLVAFLSNAIIREVGGDQAWRWMLGIEAVPALIYATLCFGLPESPRWLIAQRGERQAGIAVLQRIRPEASLQEIKAEAAEIADAAGVEEKGGTHLWSSKLRKPVALAFLIALFNQLSGINAILYFAPRIFELTGLGERAALLQSVGIGIANLVFTFVGLWLIDRAGRRALLYIGSFGYIASLGLTSWAFFTEHYSIVPFCIFAFVAAHAVGQGAVIWVFIAEIFPNRHRGAGTSLGSGTHWVFAALLTSVFPNMVELMAPGYVFLFFTSMMVLQLVWVKLMVPETKGVRLEDLQRKLGVN